MRKDIHRAWFILAGVCFANFISMGFATNVAGLFFTTISSSMAGVKYGQLSLSLTVQSLVAMTGIAVGPMVLEKISVRKLLFAETLIFAAALFSMSYFTKTWQWIAMSLVTGETQAFLGSFVFSVIIANWFQKSYNFAIGALFSVSSISGAFLNPLVSWLIETFGWRNTYRVEAALVLLLLLPLVSFVIWFQPSDVGLCAYGGKEDGDPAAGGNGENRDEDPAGARTPYRGALFYLFCLATATGTVLCCLPQHIISAGLSLGLEKETGVLAVSLFMVMAALANMLGGALIDRFGYLKVCMVYFICSAVGAGILLTKSPVGAPRFLAAILFFALGHSLVYTAMPAWARSEFPGKVFGRVYSLFQVVSWTVFALCVSGFGLIYDHAGSFVPIFLILMAASFLTEIVMLLAYCRARRMEQGNRVGGEV